MSTHNKAARLLQISHEIQGLQESPLYAFRQENDYYPVIGEGDVDAPIMFIGEAPGQREAESGRPFVGASGNVLEELLASIGLERSDVYITNVVKDRPPENRDPRADEIALYAPFLERQIEIIRPRVIAPLGRFATKFVLQHYNCPEVEQKISDLHGQIIEAQAPFGPLTIVPLYHPAVALYNRNQRETLEADFRSLLPFLPAGITPPEAETVPEGNEKPSNDEIAGILDLIADKLEAEDGASYRVRAYRRAAGSVRNSKQSVARIVRDQNEQALEELPGIGTKLAATITEYVETGRSVILDNLQD